MQKTDEEMLEKYKARVKAQNEAAKKNWDTVSCRLPKGTKDRIKALGLTVNGVINNGVLMYLDSYEKEHLSVEEPEQPTEPDQIEPEDEPQAETRCEDNTGHLLELQAAIEAKKAAQDKAAEDAQRAEEERIEREKAENVAEIMAIAERLMNGEEPKEDPEKEQARNVSKVLANTQYYQ